MLALCPVRCLLHHKVIEIDQTTFFHVTAGNTKFAVSQWPNFQPFKFLYETRLYGGNAILEMGLLCSRLKKIITDSRILVDEKAFDFVLSWAFVQKLLLAGRDVLLKIGVETAFPHQTQRKTDSPTRISTMDLPVTLQCYGAIHEMTCHIFIYAAPGATRSNWNEKSKSSSNVTSAKRCGNAVPIPALNTC